MRMKQHTARGDMWMVVTIPMVLRKAREMALADGAPPPYATGDDGPDGPFHPAGLLSHAALSFGEEVQTGLSNKLVEVACQVSGQLGRDVMHMYTRAEAIEDIDAALALLGATKP